MICLVRLIVAAVCGLLIGVERQTRMKGAGSRTHDGFARCGTDDAGFLVWFSAYRGSSRCYGNCPHAELLRGVERREKMQVTELAVGLTDGKGDLVRLYDWLAQRKITVREIDLKRQEGISMKCAHFAADFCGCRRISRVCSRLRYKRNSKAVRQKCWTAFVLDE